MGANDAQEMLEVAQAEVVRLEANEAEILAETKRLANALEDSEAERRRLLIVGKPHRQSNRRFDAMVRERDAAHAELESLRRLHEVATERSVGLAAVIEQLNGADQWDDVNRILAAVDTGPALREVRATAARDALLAEATALEQYTHMWPLDLGNITRMIRRDADIAAYNHREARS